VHHVNVGTVIVVTHGGLELYVLRRQRPRSSLIPGFALALTLAFLIGLAAMRSVQGGELQLIAGDAGDAAVVDGPPAVARLSALTGIAVDGPGNVYVADGHAIRRISTDRTVTTIVGRVGEWGTRDGADTIARFNNPQGLAVDAAGNVYVADRDNHTIRKITPEGMVSTVAGAAGSAGASDGRGPKARFFRPSGIAVDAAGNLFVSDTRNYTIRRISPAGVVSTLAGRAEQDGSQNGPATVARFSFPQGIAVDTLGNVYVADTFSHAIRKISAGGSVTTLAGQSSPPTMGSSDGSGASARFAYPSGLSIDKGGNLYVADSHSLTIRKIMPDGTVTTLAGLADHPGTQDGPGPTARFAALGALAVDRRGNLYLTDFVYIPIPATGKYVKAGPSATVRRIDAAGVVSTLGGHASNPSSSPDGSGAAARFESPSGIVADRAGTLYVTDTTANTVRKITAAGEVTALAGKSGVSGHQDGPGDQALFNNPSGIARDGSGTLYVADSASSVIRKITRDGWVSTFAGTAGVRGSVDGMGTAARFSTPSDIAIDGAGNLLVTDGWANNIRKVTPAGEVTTWANKTGQRGSTDGLADQARFVVPAGIAIDHAGNVYVCDYGNRTIRKITGDGIVSTFAGRPNPAPKRVPRSADGTGTQAEFSGPLAIAVDDTNTLYVSDGNTIRKITPNGLVSTVAGATEEAGIKLGPLPGRLEHTAGLAFIDSNTLAATERFSVLKIRFDEQVPPASPAGHR
jgi:sugar lactone lactonase YvrE